jgi:hypothetical protein
MADEFKIKVQKTKLIFPVVAEDESDISMDVDEDANEFSKK